MIDIIRLIVGATILGYAAYTDIKTREASNKLWLIMGSIGLVLLVIEQPDAFAVAISMAVIIPFSFLLYLFGMGGADVKAMWAIAVLAPLPPSIAFFPPPFFIFPLTVLINSLLLIVFLPIFFLLYNAKRGELEFPYCLFGYKMKAVEAKNKFVWSMEDKGRKSIIPVKDFDFEAEGERRIWVTPKLPFLVFIFAGYILSFVFGDVLFFLLSLFQ